VSTVNLRGVDPRRLSLGEWIAGVAAALLIVSLFLPWYSVAGTDLTAWSAMAVDDVLIAFTAAGALAALVIDAIPRLAGFAVAALSLAVIFAILGLILTISRVVDPAPPGDASLEAGAWLGLVAALGMVSGLLAGMRDEGPARRSAASARAAAAAARERAALLSLPGEPGSGRSGEQVG
jgi:hypothetical protein